ncbi:hypothetical protein N6H14_32025 [Paenibacillus sp. CC-CFT747]|nr:hypothetical protein N6H14_32025 [Paenibacillus sp. CC-CFT747]
MTLSMFVPIVNLFAKSLSHPNQVHLLRGYEVLPRGFSLINFEVVLHNPIIVRAVMNSLFITVTGTLLSLLFTTMSAYVLTRKSSSARRP